jgi:hypothetical protein
MLQSKQLTILAFAALLVAGVFVWKKREAAAKSALDAVARNEVVTTKSNRGNPRGNSGNSPVEEVTEVKPLLLPTGSLPSIEKEVDSAEVQESNKRVISGNDAILAAGGVIEAKPKLVAEEAVSRGARLKSILAKDWESKANLLVNDLRAGKGFEIGLDQVEAFLRGKDLYGWPEGQRNWIGDEMMTMLRQEMPAKAYEIFRDIQADASAPDAMRDYSIQHISHLIADGQVGQEGVSLIRAALESNNPILASTALISLRRLSEKTPQWITPDTVTQQAKTYQNSTDERLKATAQAILKELER